MNGVYTQAHALEITEIICEKAQWLLIKMKHLTAPTLFTDRSISANYYVHYCKQHSYERIVLRTTLISVLEKYLSIQLDSNTQIFGMSWFFLTFPLRMCLCDCYYVGVLPLYWIPL